MPQEQALRGCLALLFLGLLALWLWNLRRVGVTRDVFYSANEGWLLVLLIRLLAGLSLASIALYLLSPAWMSWSQLSLAVPLRWLGAPIGLAGVFEEILGYTPLWPLPASKRRAGRTSTPAEISYLDAGGESLDCSTAKSPRS